MVFDVRISQDTRCGGVGCKQRWMSGEWGSMTDGVIRGVLKYIASTWDILPAVSPRGCTTRESDIAGTVTSLSRFVRLGYTMLE